MLKKTESEIIAVRIACATAIGPGKPEAHARRGLPPGQAQIAASPARAAQTTAARWSSA